MRYHITDKLITTAKKPKAQRTVCDMLQCKRPTKRNGAERWIQCEVCGRWLHFLCLDITEAPETDVFSRH